MHGGAARAGGRRRLRLAALLVLMVALPTAAVAWLGARSTRFERERERLRLAEAAESALQGMAVAVRERLQADARDLDLVLEDLPAAVEELRRIGRSHRLIRQVFLVGQDGALRYPGERAEVMSAREREFLERTRAVWEQGILSGGNSAEGGAPEGGSWRSWVWGSGTSFLYWRRDGEGARGVEVEGAALLSDVIAVLPDTPLGEAGGARVVLTGMDGATLYQWGGYAPAEGAAPLAGRRLDAPLGGWSLSYYAPLGGSGAMARGSSFSVVASVAALALVLAGAGVYLWRESSRDAREALRRVSFVNQVSHELKTPLTNIRLYAELMERSLAGDGSAADERQRLRSKLEVIVDESRRLSRLVHNVLSFARRDRGALEVTPSVGIVDEAIRSLVGDFLPSLEQKGVAVELDCRAPDRVWVDSDALEQILANLVGNAEKYASGGGYLGIASLRQGETTEIRVRDRGPGVPPGQGERVFEPFYRVSNRLSDGVAGTGIGLTIARELARLHGGDVALGPGADGEGAEFVVSLHTPPAREGA